MDGWADFWRHSCPDCGKPHPSLPGKPRMPGLPDPWAVMDWYENHGCNRKESR